MKKTKLERGQSPHAPYRTILVIFFEKNSNFRDFDENRKIISIEMVNLMPLFCQLGPHCKRQLIMDPHFFSSFLNPNHIAWLNDFFLRNFSNIII